MLGERSPRHRLSHRVLRADNGRERERLGGGSAPAAARPLPPLAAPLAEPREGGAPEQLVCRICWEGEQQAEAGPGGRLLLGTCSCSGSLAAVHARCLLDWRRHAADPSTCGACRAPVRLPPGLAAAVALPPLWRERLGRAVEEARQSPGLAAFNLWNWAVVATGLAHALLSAQHAWLQAPAAACRLQQRAPLARRWQLLPTVACAAAYQAALGPAPLGRMQVRWLAVHAATFAAGLALESFSWLLRLPPDLAAAGSAAAGAPRPPPAGALPLLLGSAAVVLQAAGLQHLHPFLHLVQGYQRGLDRAFGWTSRLLALLPGLLPLGRGGAAAGVAATLARLLPVVAHGLYRALA